MINTLLHVRIYMRVDTGRIETISATHKMNSKGIWLYKDNGKGTKDSLRKDEATSLGDVDRLPEMDWCLRETCTLLFKDIMSSRLWCLYVFPKTRKTPKDGPAIFLISTISNKNSKMTDHYGFQKVNLLERPGAPVLNVWNWKFPKANVL